MILGHGKEGPPQWYSASVDAAEHQQDRRQRRMLGLVGPGGDLRVVRFSGVQQRASVCWILKIQGSQLALLLRLTNGA